MGVREIFPFADIACFVAAFLYLFSFAAAIVGLIYAGKPRSRHGACRALALFQLIAGGALIIPLVYIWAFTMPPLTILTILYLAMIGWRKKKQGADSGEGAGAI